MNIFKGKVKNEHMEFLFVVRKNAEDMYVAEVSGYMDSMAVAEEAFAIVHQIAAMKGIIIVKDNFDFYRDIIFNDNIPMFG